MNKPHKIYAEIIDDMAMEQFISAMNQESVVRGALMPDTHAGYSLPIGSVVATDGMVYPSWVGVDIGCGMCALPTTFSADEVRAHARDIFDQIYKTIPVGFSHNNKPSVWSNAHLERTNITREIFDKNGLNQLGSLGGGNHFIEIGADESNVVWIIIHSGSRGIGHAVATHYMRLAAGTDKAREGHFGFDANTQDGRDYITDMNFCLEFALASRREMISRAEGAISKFTDGEGKWEYLINRNHNHADYKDGLWIHRKGATHAETGMTGVIPGNMRDGSFIVRGKGNPESLYSSSHGAGRVLGRKKAQSLINMDDFSESMRGITAKVDANTIDESPFVYKDIFEVMRLQADLVDVVAHVKPIINIKG